MLKERERKRKCYNLLIIETSHHKKEFINFMPVLKSDQKKTVGILFYLILLLFLIYCGVFIYKTLFVIDGNTYSALFDDAMISMTYARNLAQGYGLVWNAGEARVEGYTNPLWMVFMAGFHLLPIAENWMSLPIQICGALFLLSSLIVLRKIALNVTGNQDKVMLLAVFITAFYYPLINWSLIGLEVSILLLWINAVVLLALQVLDTGKYSRWLYLLMGFATLIRVDAAVTYITVWGFLFLFDKQNRKQHFWEGLIVLVAFLGGQTLFRKLYYGEWLPNTYYLKVEGWPLWSRLRRGWLVFVEFSKGFFLPLMAVPFTIFLFKKDKKTVFLMLIFLAQVAYSIYVGGDAWEHRGGSNRFISLGMPVFLLLFSMACFEWYAWLRQKFSKWMPDIKSVLSKIGTAFFAIFILFSMLMWNRLIDNGNPISNLSDPAENSLRYFLLLQPSVYKSGTERETEDAVFIERMTTADATVATVAAGNVCYFSHRECVDLFGKSDPVVAHGGIQVPFDADWDDLRPGHVKFNYKYSIGELQPDIVVEIMKSTFDQAEPYLMNYEAAMINGHLMYFKTGSANIDWDMLEATRED